MSEWGNPTVYGSNSEFFRMRTQGSETSQYLEEKKAIIGTFCLIGSQSFIILNYFNSLNILESVGSITIRQKVPAIP